MPNPIILYRYFKLFLSPKENVYAQKSEAEFGCRLITANDQV